MDVFTQGVIGAAAAQSIASKDAVRRASVIGFLSGLLADADVLIRSYSDPLLTLEYHRHFSHSLFFLPIGALIACLFLWPFFRKGLGFKRLYVFCFAGNLFSGFIDTCTSYGTYLLWPLLDERLAWNIISIIDPVFTLALLAAVIVAIKNRSSTASRYGLVFVSFYLLLGFAQLQRAEALGLELAASRGHQVQQHIVKPTIGNILLWRSVYLYDDIFYIDAIRVGLTARTYIGESIARFDFDSLPEQVNADSMLYKDIERFSIFSDGNVAYYPGKSDVLGDVRYAMSPLSATPLWGIEMDFNRPNQHVRYEFYRTVSKQRRQQFIDMLFGKDL